MIRDPAQAGVVERLDRLSSTLSQPTRLFRRTPSPRGLYIHGGAGRGKSMLMDLFFAAAPVARKKRVHFNAFMLDVHRRLHEARNTGRADPLPQVAAQLARETRLLCFDEFQVGDIADAMILARLFTHLLDAGVVVVATSNIPPRDLYAGGLQRPLFLPFIALLEQRLDIIAIGEGVDYRMQRLAGQCIWFSPDDAQATAELDRLMADLAASEPIVATTLDVAGRALAVPLAATRLARFTFGQLCRTAHGAADYIALASRFEVLMLDHIPLLEERNETLRFIALVDQLYETRTCLIASAATLPEQLYPSGPYDFQFQRTQSRLMEMQSAGYLKKITAR